MSAQVVVGLSAEQDIESIIDWYLENASEYAQRFLDDLAETIDQIGHSPRLFRTVHGEVRPAALHRFPYLVWLIYFDEVNTVNILAISHQRQDPENTRQRIK